MDDLPPAPAPTRSPPNRTLLIGGGAFVGGILLTAGAFQLSHRFLTDPAPVPVPAAHAPRTEPSTAPSLPAGTDIATLNARESELAGRLDQLQLRLHDIEGSARSASLYAGRAERLMVAAGVRRSLERGQPLGPLDRQLHQRFGEDHVEAVAAIARAAADPVTLGDLRLALDTIAPRLTAGMGDTLWMRIRRLLSDLVVVRQADSPSPRTSERLRRARWALDRGDVEASLAEVVHLPGAASAESWVSAAKRYVAARQGLSEIEKAALETPPATVPVAAPLAPAPEPVVEG
jgi:hypothetical protein